MNNFLLMYKHFGKYCELYLHDQQVKMAKEKVYSYKNSLTSTFNHTVSGRFKIVAKLFQLA